MNGGDTNDEEFSSEYSNHSERDPTEAFDDQDDGFAICQSSNGTPPSGLASNSFYVCWLFVKKIIHLFAWRTLFLFLPASPLSQSQTFLRILSRHGALLGLLTSIGALLLEFGSYMDTVRCANNI